MQNSFRIFIELLISSLIILYREFILTKKQNVKFNDCVDKGKKLNRSKSS